MYVLSAGSGTVNWKQHKPVSPSPQLTSGTHHIKAAQTLIRDRFPDIGGLFCPTWGPHFLSQLPTAKSGSTL